MTSLPAIALTPDDQGRPTCLSTDVALHFQRRHSHILRDIDRIKSLCPSSFTEPNFGLSEYTDPTGRKLKTYRLTRDAFSLLVMGMTGSAAIRWKLRISVDGVTVSRGKEQSGGHAVVRIAWSLADMRGTTGETEIAL